MTVDLLVEPLAVVTGIAAVALTVKQRVINWPIGIVSTALFLYLFVRAGLYADSALQVLYIGLNLYGWWHWLQGGPTGDDLAVSSVSKRSLVIGFVLVVCSVGAVGAFLDASTDSTVPYPDAATTVLSVAAQILLTRKLIESWPLWIFGVNVPYVAIYVYKGLPLTAALQFVFIALSIAGWLEWRRSMLESRSGASATAPSVTGATG
jgi:nicotinamide mononucleotide transporter